MNWRKPQRVNAVRSFTLESFFVQYPRSLHTATPTYNADNAPLNTYAPDFGNISANVRTAAGYKCQRCKIDLSAKPLRKYLHVHHIDGSKFNNSVTNLKALCLECHAEELIHHHMKNLPDYWLFRQLKATLNELANGS
jgi:5-methylcytosine-specific restriction endonuclease McrA